MFEGKMTYSNNIEAIEFTSDLHVANSMEKVWTLDDFVSRNGSVQRVIVGDWTPGNRHIDETHHLREATYRAQEKGVPEHEEIIKAMQGCEFYDIAMQYAPIAELTEKRVRKFNEYHDKGLIKNPITNTEGNSDQEIAVNLRRMYNKLGAQEKTNKEIVDNARFIRELKGVEYQYTGNSLVIMIPYDKSGRFEDAARVTLDSIVNTLKSNHPDYVIIASHENPSPEGLFPEGKAQPADMKKIFDEYINKIKEAKPNAKISFVCGHTHKLAPPYEYKGVTIYTVGVEGNTVRVLIYNPKTGQTSFRDVDITNSEQEIAEIDKIVEEMAEKYDIRKEKYCSKDEEKGKASKNRKYKGKTNARSGKDDSGGEKSEQAGSESGEDSEDRDGGDGESGDEGDSSGDGGGDGE